MSRTRSLFFALAALMLGSSVQAQQSIVAPSRSIDWRGAGVPGGIPSRTTICTTLSPGATASQINSAIQTCPAGQVVFLSAGTYNLSSGITFGDKSNVTLRGAGPNKTLLVFSNTVSCGGLESLICVPNGHLNHVQSVGNLANWTAGYAKGATSITLSSTANLKVGTLLFLDQANDSNTDNRGVWVCEADNVCSDEGGTAGRSGRAQWQTVVVTSISGSTVGISPGLYMPNWRASQSPQAWWSNDTPISGVGIESLKIDASGETSHRSAVTFYNAYGSWVRNIFVYKSRRSHVLLHQASHVTIRDSYFYDAQTHASQSYGIETAEGSSDFLIENNIMHKITSPFQGTGNTGGVVAYNYTFNDEYTVSLSWMQPSNANHASGVTFTLAEGNEGTGFQADGIHGTQHFLTGFRNYWHGTEPGKTAQTNPVYDYAFNRYFNFVGNVLGEPGYHTTYEAQSSRAIWNLGDGPGSGIADDPLVAATILRWGNYDVATGTARFATSEVPSGLSQFANPVPANQSLPASFYLPGRPSWWGSVPWPAIGPDVTGGDVANLGGHVFKIPARLCYESTAKSGAMLTNFNADACYGNTSTPPPPAAPSNLRIVR
jgi:hypothetical protein